MVKNQPKSHSRKSQAQKVNKATERGPLMANPERNTIKKDRLRYMHKEKTISAVNSQDTEG